MMVRPVDRLGAHRAVQTKTPIEAQIAEVKRELALRGNAYPRLIGSGRMRQSEAELCTQRMEAVLATLMFCQRHEAAIREFIGTKNDGETPRDA